MARARPDWVQILDPESGHWCWYSALRQESRWEKPPIQDGWLEWRDSHGNAFYVDDAGASTWDPPWREDDADAADVAAGGDAVAASASADEAPETTREAPDAPVAPDPPAPPVPKTDAIDELKPMDRAAPKAPAYYGANAAEAHETGSTYAPPRPGTDLLAYERQRAALLVAAYRERSAASRERRLRDDREALDRDRAALDRERQLLALERLRSENRNLPARSAVAALVVATSMARKQ